MTTNLISGKTPSAYSGYTTFNGYYGVLAWTDGAYDKLEGYITSAKGQPSYLEVEWTLDQLSNISSMTFTGMIPTENFTWTMNLYYDGSWHEISSQSNYDSYVTNDPNFYTYIKNGSWSGVSKAKITVSRNSTGINAAFSTEVEVFGTVGYPNKINGVASSSIGKVNGIASSSIKKVSGV